MQEIEYVTEEKVDNSCENLKNLAYSAPDLSCVRKASTIWIIGLLKKKNTLAAGNLDGPDDGTLTRKFNDSQRVWQAQEKKKQIKGPLRGPWLYWFCRTTCFTVGSESQRVGSLGQGCNFQGSYLVPDGLSRLQIGFSAKVLAGCREGVPSGSLSVGNNLSLWRMARLRVKTSQTHELSTFSAVTY